MTPKEITTAKKRGLVIFSIKSVKDVELCNYCGGDGVAALL